MTLGLSGQQWPQKGQEGAGRRGGRGCLWTDHGQSPGSSSQLAAAGHSPSHRDIENELTVLGLRGGPGPSLHKASRTRPEDGAAHGCSSRPGQTQRHPRVCPTTSTGSPIQAPPGRPQPHRRPIEPHDPSGTQRPACARAGPSQALSHGRCRDIHPSEKPQGPDARSWATDACVRATNARAQTPSPPMPARTSPRHRRTRAHAHATDAHARAPAPPTHAHAPPRPARPRPVALLRPRLTQT